MTPSDLYLSIGDDTQPRTDLRRGTRQQLAAVRSESRRTMKHESPPSEWSVDNRIPSTRALNLSTT
jgi:hypothetical protein